MTISKSLFSPTSKNSNEFLDWSVLAKLSNGARKYS